MRKTAFSLVELSIVLVILGLLVGGVLTGQSLIRAAELRSVTTDAQRYITAVQTFRDRFFAIPGDMRNATEFWGTAANCPGTAAQGSTDSATCDGNGNGILNSTLTNAASNEIYRFWQQLANAGLIEGSYSGVTGTGHANIHSDNVTNSPRARLSNAGFSVFRYDSVDESNTLLFEGRYGNMLLFGGITPNGPNQNFILRPEELWNLDTKSDDGRPGTGFIRTYESHTSCHDAGATSTTASLASTAEYNLSSSSVVCASLFSTGF